MVSHFTKFRLIHFTETRVTNSPRFYSNNIFSLNAKFFKKLSSISITFLKTKLTLPIWVQSSSSLVVGVIVFFTLSTACSEHHEPATNEKGHKVLSKWKVTTKCLPEDSSSISSMEKFILKRVQSPESSFQFLPKDLQSKKLFESKNLTLH